jgi:hypothetical protein
MTERPDDRVVRTETGYGVRDGDPQAVPNKADAAWAELEALRAEARALGLEVDDAEPLAALRARVEAARASQ